MASFRILKCPSCGSYALTEGCPCGAARIPPKPPKYSPDDKYAEYRRKYKEQAAPAAAKPTHPTMHPMEAKRRGLEEAR